MLYVIKYITTKQLPPEVTMYLELILSRILTIQPGGHEHTPLPWHIPPLWHEQRGGHRRDFRQGTSHLKCT